MTNEESTATDYLAEVRQESEAESEDEVRLRENFQNVNCHGNPTHRMSALSNSENK